VVVRVVVVVIVIIGRIMTTEHIEDDKGPGEGIKYEEF